MGNSFLTCLLLILLRCSTVTSSCEVHENKTSDDRHYHYNQYSALYSYIICDNVNRADLSELNLPRSYEKSVKYIMFKNSSINSIPPAAFSRLSNLEVIYLNNSKITKYDGNPFAGLRNMKEIYLDHNSLTTIHFGNFDTVNGLYVLDLSFNNIATVEAGPVYPFSNLNKLSLNNNEIREITTTAFYSFVNLEYLDLSFNKLVSLSEALSKTTKLLSLKLNNNFIKSISANFSDYKFLKYVDMSHNNIAEIDGSIFPKSLLYLNISHNNLNSLRRICEMTNLVDFDVSSNNITFVENDLFKNMKKLNTIQMQGNHLRELPIGFLSGCNSTATLNLSRNELLVIEYGLFSGLVGLVNLDLSFNNIEVLEADTFYSLPNLETLDISFNKITSLSLYKLEQHCKSMKSINLNGNNFTCAALSSIIRDARYSHFGRRSVDILQGTFENVTNVLGIPCRNTNNNNNLLYTVVSSVPNSRNSSLIKELESFFDDGFKNTTFYRFFTDNRIHKFESVEDEKLFSNDEIIGLLRMIEHWLIALVVIIIIIIILFIAKYVFKFRHSTKPNMTEHKFLL